MIRVHLNKKDMIMQNKWLYEPANIADPEMPPQYWLEKAAEYGRQSKPTSTPKDNTMSGSTKFWIAAAITGWGWLNYVAWFDVLSRIKDDASIPVASGALLFAIEICVLFLAWLAWEQSCCHYEYKGIYAISIGGLIIYINRVLDRIFE